MYAVAHHGLVSFLTLLDPDFIDTCLKQGQTISKLDDRIVQQRVSSGNKVIEGEADYARRISPNQFEGFTTCNRGGGRGKSGVKAAIGKGQPEHHRTAAGKRKTSGASLRNYSGYSKGTSRRSADDQYTKTIYFPN